MREDSVKGHVWQQEELAKLFLADVRGAIPLAAAQMDAVLRIVRKTLPKIERVLDLGCGDGILGRAVLAEYPAARGVFLDFSEPMIAAARRKAAEHALPATFVVQDFGAKDWRNSIAGHAPFDLVLSGLAIHHQPDERKRELYREIFDLLKPGGVFLNQEHVARQSAWAERAFDEALRRLPVGPSSRAGRHEISGQRRPRVLPPARQAGQHPGPAGGPVPMARGNRLRRRGLLLQGVRAGRVWRPPRAGG